MEGNFLLRMNPVRNQHTPQLDWTAEGGINIQQQNIIKRHSGF
jgi:hypothetical protein